ncbi:MAG TPA: LysM peptidoglycan-binding domain-containing protein [Candidatus Ozemobacteraceae bacterium]|nr:LysM peptidoglycan-binding domain-containing protein [Candidatus Ozemobacteraceae bacterium]
MNRNSSRWLLLLGGLAVATPAVIAQTSPFSGGQVTLPPEKAPVDSSETLSTSLPAITTESGSPSESAANSPAAVRSAYTVRRGDTLCEIARRLLGDPRRYQELVRLNKDRYPSLASNPNLILVGWELKLPGTAASQTAIVSGVPAVPSSETAAAPATPSPQAPTTSPSVSQEASAAPGASQPVAGGPLIGPGQRVLHIGDSHTVGIYGSTIDQAMRETGAQIRTIGVAGSSPSWWYQGTVTKCGYYARNEKGAVDRPADWRTPRATPSLPEMIREYKPTVLVVSLGANLFGASEATVKRETQRIIDTAKAAGCTLVWVGPPRARESVKSIAAQDRLCETIKATVGTQGTFVDSRPVTNYPSSGGDGLHYWGTEGSKTAKAWAGSVLDTIQKSGKKN